MEEFCDAQKVDFVLWRLAKKKAHLNVAVSLLSQYMPFTFLFMR
jgi:uncharacterized protein YijF (DUF1287 family)